MSEPEYTAYVILLSKIRPFTPDVIDVIRAHVDHLKALDDQDCLVLCGPFIDYEGGMVVVRAGSKDEEQRIAESDPFVRDGYESYELRTLDISCKENGYLLL